VFNVQYSAENTVEHFVLYTVLQYVAHIAVEMETNTGWEDHDGGELSYPGRPPLSMWLAKVTSSLHTSNCHFRKPSTPHSTFPVWIPILMSTLNPVASRTNLQDSIREYFLSRMRIVVLYSYILAALFNLTIIRFWIWFL